LEERHMTVELTEAAKEFLVSEGFDPNYGARPLKRTIQRRILDPLAFKVLDGTFKDGDKVAVDARDGGIAFEKAREAEQKPAKKSAKSASGQRNQ